MRLILDDQPRTLNNENPCMKYPYDIDEKQIHCRVYVEKVAGSLSVDFRHGSIVLSALPSMSNDQRIEYEPVSYTGVSVEIIEQ